MVLKITGKFTNGYNNYSLLGWAVNDGNTEKAKVLLKHRTSQNAKIIANSKIIFYNNRKDDTLLHFAVAKKNPQMVDLLIKYGTEVNAQNEWGDTPLHDAVTYEYTDIIKLLYQNGADVDNIKNNKGETAADLAHDYYHGKTVKEIAAEGADVSSDHSVQTKAVPNCSFRSSSILSTVKTSTFSALNSLFRNTPALPFNRQFTTLSESTFSALQDNFNGMVQFASLVVGYFTGVKYSRQVDNLPLTKKEIQERKLDAIERTFKAAIDKFGPKSSLSSTTISKVARNNTVTMN